MTAGGSGRRPPKQVERRGPPAREADGAHGATAAVTARSPAGSWLGAFARRVALWAVPVWAVWTIATPWYNRFLTVATGNLFAIAERPAATRLDTKPPHHLVITRADVGRGVGLPYSVRVTDVHFPLILLGALFLGTPGVPWRRRLHGLGYATLVMIFFHLIDLVAWVQFVYTTQLGEWSLRNYGPVARNGWGLAKHLLDLPVKLAMPLALWAWFHLDALMPGRREPGPT